MADILLPIADSGFENGSDDASAYAVTETESSSDDAIPHDSVMGARSSWGLRLRTTPNAAGWLLSLVRVHPSHQNDAGIQLLVAALQDLGRELVRAGTRSPAAHYPRDVPRCPMDAAWHFRLW